MSRRSFIVGLTGGIASGKTNLSNALRSRGVRVIDADEISRQLTADGGQALPALREAFGDGVFDGASLNRRRLGELVFSDEEKRAQLNALLHPLILREIKAQIDRVEGMAVVDAPLLFETGIDKWCDQVWCAYVPQKEQVKRLTERDHISRREALRRIRSQMPAREKTKKSHQVIRTTGAREESAQKVLDLWNQLEATIKGEPCHA